MFQIIFCLPKAQHSKETILMMSLVKHLASLLYLHLGNLAGTFIQSDLQ